MTLWTVVGLGVAIARLQTPPPTLTLRAPRSARRPSTSSTGCGAATRRRRASAKMLPKFAPSSTLRAPTPRARAARRAAGRRRAAEARAAAAAGAEPRRRRQHGAVAAGAAGAARRRRGRAGQVGAADAVAHRVRQHASGGQAGGAGRALQRHGHRGREAARAGAFTYDAASVEQKLGAFGELLPGVDAQAAGRRRACSRSTRAARSRPSSRRCKISSRRRRP